MSEESDLPPRPDHRQTPEEAERGRALEIVATCTNIAAWANIVSTQARWRDFKKAKEALETLRQHSETAGALIDEAERIKNLLAARGGLR